ncbi:MAG TPA: T9SS type A sorting domain-containing protein, partial [Ignavibacteria bacterium]|nr:T9SS type A sorting domain-containing protein [Ignavibacteria bacterium]
DFKKTTNGGLNWVNIPLPTQFTPIEGGFLIDGIYEFQIINKDTIWAAGPYIGYNGGRNRGILYISNNGGQTWGYQLPDTSFGIRQYKDLNFINKKISWAYSRFQNLGVHTVTGGDSTRIITNIIPITTEIPDKFILFQNFPNPFNPETNISFSLFETGVVTLTIYDITGKEIEVLLNKTMNTGEYSINWNAKNYPGGVYFYKLSSDNFNETKKMILIK